MSLDWLFGHRCKPIRWRQSGADHTGYDYWLQCKCGRRTIGHVEGHKATPQIDAMLAAEWKAGRIQESNQ